MRILITFAKLSACPIIACLLLVGGCVQEIDRDELRSALRDLHQEYYNDPLIDWSEVDDSITSTDVNDPCPPCPPETLYRMPPGVWVDIHRLCNWCEARGRLQGEPDSVFILSREE